MSRGLVIDNYKFNVSNNLLNHFTTTFWLSYIVFSEIFESLKILLISSEDGHKTGLKKQIFHDTDNKFDAPEDL